MIKLNLETKNLEQERIKEYLENNASEILADKINNGVKITKENKTLLNKKNLDGFWNYATGEARKLKTNNSSGIYVDDKTVFGWAIHYFEEDTIEGTLYNEDGTEYKTITKTTCKAKPEPKKEEKPQQSLFDLLTSTPPKEQPKEENNTCECCCDDDEEFTEEEKQEIIAMETKQIPEYYKQYCEQVDNYPDIVVLTRLGDFYEAFNECAERIASLLDLTLASKDVGLENKVKLAGFPYHIKEKYLAKLQEKYTILVIEDNKMNFIKQKETEIPEQTFDKFLLKTISSILDGKVVIQ